MELNNLKGFKFIIRSRPFELFRDSSFRVFLEFETFTCWFNLYTNEPKNAIDIMYGHDWSRFENVATNHPNFLKWEQGDGAFILKLRDGEVNSFPTLPSTLDRPPFLIIDRK